MAHVFISYKREVDEAFAKELDTQLCNAEFEVWRDEQIPGGKKWLDEIELKIHESFAVVVVVSPQAIESEWVNYEWIFARGAGIDIVPIGLKTIKKFPCRLNDYQLIDFRHTYEWGKLFARLGDIRDEKRLKIYIPPKASAQVKEGLKLLNSAASENKIMGAKLLGKLADPIAVEGLSQTLKDNDWVVCGAVAEALGAIGEEQGTKPLLECLIAYYQCGQPYGHELPEHTDTIISNALIRIGSQIIPHVTEDLKHPISDVRKTLASTLGKIQDKQALRALLGSLEDEDLETLICKVWAIGQIRDESTVPVLIKMLNDDLNNSVKTACVDAIGVIGGDLAVETLIQVLRDNSDELPQFTTHPINSVEFHHSPRAPQRQIAAAALGNLGTKIAIEPLYDVLVSTSDQNLINSVDGALRRLVGDNELDLLVSKIRQSKAKGLALNIEKILITRIKSIGTSKALTVIEQWNQM